MVRAGVMADRVSVSMSPYTSRAMEHTATRAAARRLDFRNTGRTGRGPLRKWWARSDSAWSL
jgi:hypothetical protein